MVGGQRRGRCGCSCSRSWIRDHRPQPRWRLARRGTLGAGSARGQLGLILDRPELLAMPGVDVLPLPFDPQRLQAALTRVLQHPRTPPSAEPDQQSTALLEDVPDLDASPDPDWLSTTPEPGPEPIPEPQPEPEPEPIPEPEPVPEPVPEPQPEPEPEPIPEPEPEPIPEPPARTRARAGPRPART